MLQLYAIVNMGDLPVWPVWLLRDVTSVPHTCKSISLSSSSKNVAGKEVGFYFALFLMNLERILSILSLDST